MASEGTQASTPLYQLLRRPNWPALRKIAYSRRHANRVQFLRACYELQCQFHYIGDPTSALGKRTTARVIRWLGEAGFSRVARHPEAFGVVAFK